MSSVNTFLVQDDRLLVTDQVRYAVLKGAANNTVVPYQAISGVVAGDAVAGNTLQPLTWNIQVPSQEVVIDRRAMVNYRVNILYSKTVSATGVNDFTWNASAQEGAGAGAALNTGVALSCDSLNAFPVSQCMQTIQATINNTTVSMNVQDTLNALLRFHDSRDLNEYMGLCPYLVDRMGVYNAPANSSSAFQSQGVTVLDEAFLPRSAYPVRITAGTVVTPATAAATTVNVEFECWEPLLVSPFIWAKPEVNCQGIYGVQNISVVANFGSALRMVRHLSQRIAAGDCVSSATITGVRINNAQLYLNYLTPQPSSVMVPRNVVPYVEVPRYYLADGISIGASALTNRSLIEATPATGEVRSNNLQLNQIPDKLIIAFEPTSVAGTSYGANLSVPDFYAVINRLSLNFNNQSGLLSTWTEKDLFHASRDAGSKQSWSEFSGQIQAPAIAQNGLDRNTPITTALTFGPLNLPTSGSIVMLQFGKDIELPDYYAPGSIGNFNLQINANISHFQPASCTYRMLVITVNSGVFVTEKGTSNPYTALLRKEDVLNASSQEALGCREFNRMVGGGFFDTLKSIGSTVWKYGKPVLKALAPVAQSMLSQSSDPRAQMASKGIGIASKFLGEGMGAGMGAGERLMKHAKGSGYAY